MTRKIAFGLSCIFIICMVATTLSFAGTNGVFNKTMSNGYKMKLLTADGSNAQQVTGDVSGKTHSYTFFQNVEKAKLTFEGTANTQYMVFLLDNSAGSENPVPQADNIKYIDQTESDSEGNVEFEIYPSEISKQSDDSINEYDVCVSDSNGFKVVGTINVADWTDSGYTLGDINNDSTVDIVDVSLILQFLAGKKTLSEDVYNEQLASNVNFDSTIDIVDVSYILQFLAGKMEFF